MTPGINFINEIRRNLYEVENKKNLSAPKIKEIEENLLKLEENLFKTKNIMVMIILNVKEQEM